MSILKRAFSIFTKQEKVKLLLSLALIIFNGLFEMFTVGLIAFFARVLIDPKYGREKLSHFFSPNTLTDHFLILFLSAFLGVSYFFKNVFGIFDLFHQSKIVQNISLRVKKQILENLSKFKFEVFTAKNSTDYVMIVQNDISAFFQVGMIQSLLFINEVFVFVFLISFVIYLNVKAFFFILPLVAISWIVLKKFVFPFFESLGKKQSDFGTASHKSIYQFFHSFKEVILFQKIVYLVADFVEKDKKYQKSLYNQQTSIAAPRFFLEVFFVIIFIFAVGIINVTATDLTHSVSVISSYLYLGFRLLPSLNRMIGALGSIRSILPKFENFFPYYNFDPALSNVVHDCPNFHFQQSICFQNVSFSYANSKQFALKNFSFEFLKNSCIGIVGKTGSGKSTLVDLFLGILKPTSGDILIDRAFSPNTAQWQMKIGYVPQSIYLIDGTIEENIVFFIDNEIDEEALTFAIRAAQLTDLISKLPLGIKTLVGERGVKLSGGERQRVAIARALFRKPEVLVFDEATSALDSETEDMLMDTIYSVSQNRTVIMIAHRITTLKRCDKILQFSEGELLSEVFYDDLLIQKMNVKNLEFARN